MTLSAPIGSLSSSPAASTQAPPHRHHGDGFGQDMDAASRQTSQAAASGSGMQAASLAASGAGGLLSSDLLQQLQTLAGQAGSVIGAIG